MRYAAAALLLVLACGRAPKPGPGAGWPRVDASSFAEELAAASPTPPRLVIVDVREPSLFAKEHLPGAINLPYPAAKTLAPVQLDTADAIVLVCHTGPMGDQVAAILAARGFRHVRNLTGGMKGWTGPVEPGS